MTKLLRLVLAIIIAGAIHSTANSQSVSINTTGIPANNSSILDVSSTSKGVLVPRMSKTEKNSITTPATGLLVFQATPDSVGFYYYDGAKWVWLNDGNNADTTAWKITGNSNITSARFLGTTNDSALRFRIRNREGGIIDSISASTALGYQSLPNVGNVASHNTAVGYKSLLTNSSSIYNTGVGSNALRLNTSGNYNTAVGAIAMQLDTSGWYNTAVGYLALQTTTKGYENVGIGVQTNLYGDSTSYTTAVGTNAAYYNRRNNTTAIGHGALFFNSYGSNSSPFISTNLEEGKSNTAVGFQSGYFNNRGSRNTSLGYRANYGPNGFNPSSNRNVAIGDSALAGNYFPGNTAVGSVALGKNNGDENTAIGDSAMANATGAAANEAMGFNALKSLKNIYSAGYWNTSIGGQSMEYDTAAYATVAVGFRALRNPKKVTETVAVGVGAMENGDSTYWSTAVGRYALFNFGHSAENTAIGFAAMANKRSGVWNTAVGNVSLEQDSSGVGNTGIGVSAFRFNKKSNDNVGVGLDAGYYSLGNGADGGNVFIGNYAGFGASGLSTGTYNNALGFNALHSFTTASANVAIGNNALGVTTTGGQNVGIGDNALGSNTTGLLNVVVGAGAKDQSISGSRNVAMGFWADRGDTSGNNNVILGHVAMQFNANRSNIVAVGDSALYQNGFGIASANTINGLRNTAVGSAALRFNTDGYNNTAVGFNSLRSPNSGISNTAVGNSALRTSSGTGNTGIGDSALYTNLSGSRNTAIGYNADNSTTNLSNATAIGANAYAGQSNSIVLGSISGINNATATVNVGIGVNTPADRLHVRRNGASGGAFLSTASTIIEDNATSYLQFSNPNANETGLLSGNAVTTIRSGIVFRADSSIHFRSGGNITAMTIDNTNFVGIGNTAPGDLLHVGTTTGARIRIGSLESLEDFGGSIIGINSHFVPTSNNLWSLGNTTDRWNTLYATNGVINTSDAREKENISNLSYGLNEIMKLRPVIFNWKENPQWGKKIGFIAQEVQPILSEVVQVGDLKSKTPSKDVDINAKPATPSDKLGVYYSDIIPVTVKAIQEQQLIIEKQQKQIEELLKRVVKLENK